MLNIFVEFANKFKIEKTNIDSNIFTVFELFFFEYERILFANIWYSLKLYLLLQVNPSLLHLYLYTSLFTSKSYLLLMSSSMWEGPNRLRMSLPPWTTGTSPALNFKNACINKDKQCKPVQNCKFFFYITKKKMKSWIDNTKLYSFLTIYIFLTIFMLQKIHFLITSIRLFCLYTINTNLKDNVYYL